MMKSDETSRPIDPQVRIGHVHLKVADLERALRFYCGVLGFELTQRYGTQAAFVSAGGYHHHIGLNTWESLGGSPPPPGTTGLYHTAILYPTRRALADALRRVLVDEDWWQVLRLGVTAVARPYTWERCAAETAQVYRSVVTGVPSRTTPADQAA